MNRNQKILEHIKRDGYGIEIGPSHNPIAPKRAGYNVETIDHMSKEGLIAKYTGHGVNLDNIEEVDYIWQGENYSELIGRENYYDWIIASHVIEHSPNLIGFLNDCARLLKEDGVLSLVIPDKRYCFDRYRPITGLSKIVDSYLNENKIHTAGTVAEYFLNVVSRSGQIAWGAGTTGNYNFVHTLNNAMEGINSVTQENAYIDVHAWCFVPHSFRLIVRDLFALNLISLQEIDFYPTEGCEFYITLGKTGGGVNQSRMELLEIIEQEIADEVFSKQAPSTPVNTVATPQVSRPDRAIKRFLRRFI